MGWPRTNPWRGLGGLPRPVWVIAAALLVNRAGTMVLPFLALYLTGGLGFGGGFAGFGLALFGGVSLVTSPIGGRLADAWGPERVMKWSLVTSALVLLVFPFARGTVAVLAAIGAFAFTSELFRPAGLAAIADHAAPEQRRAAFALVRLAVNLGMSVGPAVGGFLASVSFPALFWADAGTSFAAAILLIAARARRAAVPRVTLDGGAALLAGSAWRDPRLLAFLLALLPVLLVFFQHISSMSLFVVGELGLSEATYGLMFTLNTLIIVLVEVPLNLSMAHWRMRTSLALGAALTAAGFGAMALARDAWSLAATVIVWTFGEMILLPSSNAYVAEIAPPGRSGEYMGLYTMGFSLAFVFGPWLGVAGLQRFGGAGLWPACFVAGMISAMSFTRMRKMSD
ncbi:MAG: MFS transporter [Acidobacteria bacterium]|nr:MFS transporter [Acidobacteriota bacterium]